MPKNIINDIKIKDKGIHKLPPADILVSEQHKNTFEYPKKIKHKDNKPRPIIARWIVILFFIVVLSSSFYLISNYFSNIKIYIQSKTQSFTLTDEVFTATKDKNSGLTFEVTVLSDKATKDVNFIKGEDVSTYAVGEVVLFNESSTKPQVIPVNTKLSDPNNNIYVTTNAASIPGYKLIKGKISAGSVGVKIRANAVGEVYNGEPRDFNLPIFKNTSKYTKVYGRSKTPLSGGQQGSVYIISPENRGELEAYAKSTFYSVMMKKLHALVPPGYVLYDSGTNFTYNIDDTKKFENTSGKVTINGTISAIIFPKQDFENTITKRVLPNISMEEIKEVTVDDVNKFNFVLNTPTSDINKDINSVSFSLGGSSSILWHPYKDNLTTALRGINKTNALEEIKKDPGVVTSSMKFYPPWMSYLPNDTSKIQIFIK